MIEKCINAQFFKPFFLSSISLSVQTFCLIWKLIVIEITHALWCFFTTPCVWLLSDFFVSIYMHTTSAWHSSGDYSGKQIWSKCVTTSLKYKHAVSTPFRSVVLLLGWQKNGLMPQIRPLIKSMSSGHLNFGCSQQTL